MFDLLSNNINSMRRNKDSHTLYTAINISRNLSISEIFKHLLKLPLFSFRFFSRDEQNSTIGLVKSKSLPKLLSAKIRGLSRAA